MTTHIIRLRLAASLAGAALLATAATAVQPADTAEPPPYNAKAAAELALEAPVAAALAKVDDLARQFHQHVTTLSNPFFEGRGTGSRGNDLAADYIAWYFEQLELAPAFREAGADDTFPVARHSYFQPFITGSRAVAEVGKVSMTTNHADAPITLSLSDSFTVMGIAGDATVTAPLAFVGYSIDDAPSGYDSYPDDTDLTGRIAVMFRFEPVDDEGRSRFVRPSEPGRRTPRWSFAAGIRDKIEAAVSRGAAGIILVNPPGVDDPRTRRLDSTETSSRWRRRPLEIPAVMMSAEAADVLLSRTDPQHRSVLDFRRLADAKGGVIELDNTQITLSTRVGREGQGTQNVGAILPGVGELADEYIVVGAHYDHVGRGEAGGSRTGANGQIHPGADDNASGTAGLILAAELLARRYDELGNRVPRRSVLFVAFSGEEIGLIGSRHLLDNPPIEIESIAAMLNLDMIGRLRRNELLVYGTGTAENFGDVIDPYLNATGLTIERQPGGAGPSDHFNFFGREIPVLHLFTGLHQGYHAPGDQYHLINNVGGAIVSRLTADLAFELAKRPERLKFVDDRTPDTDMYNIRPD